MTRRCRFRVLKTAILLAACAGVFAFQRPAGSTASAAVIEDAFATGWMLADTNNDGLADFVNGKIVVPANPSAAENAAAADLAARVGFATTGLTLPIVVNASASGGGGPRIWIRPVSLPEELAKLASGFSDDEGGIFAIGGNLALVAHGDKGLLAAAEAYAARAPYQWKVPGDKLAAIATAVGSGAQLVAVTYKRGTNGIYRAVLRSQNPVTIAALSAAFASNHLAGVRELVALGGPSPVAIMNPKALPTETAPAAVAPAAAGPGGEPAPSKRLDLATLYTSRGLFNGTPRMPVPSSLDARLYVPAGAVGMALANLAARMGLETTGLTLPLASPITDAAAKDIRTQAVIAGDSALSKDAETKLRAQDTVAAEAETALTPGQGELRIVDGAFARHGALLTRGDEAGAAAALELLSNHFPNLWETGKPYLSLEEIRYDLHRFFSQRSGAGQAAVGLYHLDRWMKEIGSGSIKDVKAELYVDVADNGLDGFIRGEMQRRIHAANIDVQTGSLHAGMRCCDQQPNVHYQSPLQPFHPAAPTFTEDLVIPWEGTRLVDAVRGAASKIRRGSRVQLMARVSEGPEQRRKLQAQIEEILKRSGADPKQLHVAVLCAYKQGYSWLMDEIAPRLADKPVASLKIDFAKNIDTTGERVMFSPARWVQELYPVDEMLARKLNLPLGKIELNQIESPAAGPTYRVHAFDASGSEIFTSDFIVASVMQPYNSVMSRYEQVQVETGWVRLEQGSKVLLDQRIKTDPEEFWDHYQNVTLPKVYHAVMAQAHGDLRPEFAPPFDTIRIDIHMSEPDYSLDLDKERISSLEALQEDTFYSTENFVNMMGNLEAGRSMSYVGRIIPIVHASEDGKDGRVHIEFYAKPAANPVVRLSWTDAQGHRQERERNLPALIGELQPRLIQARVKAGETGVESLTWLLPADYLEDKYDDWLKVEGQDQVDRTIFAVERARGQLHWLEAMHAAGIYRDDVAYPHLNRMAVEFDLPIPLTAKTGSPAPRAYASWAVSPPATPRPMIADYAEKSPGPFNVPWDEPIGPEENAKLLARLGTFPGVTVYWLGRSYLGRNMWAADIMLPSPSTLRSRAKESTLKASVVYSGRQHANEVSSTSHILKLGEQLINDPETRAMLKQVNVVLHPIDNPDGADLSMDLAKITPDNVLHPGYHGSLGADVVAGQSETDPLYPESRTRRQLLEEWLPDAFLNPHGYPSHEWVQPFSEYTGWVQTREQANPGRAWWIPRGWFTSLNYLRDPEHPYSMQVAYAIRDRIVEAERSVPGLLPLEERMNARYERFGQRWQPRNMFQPIVNGIRIYMALKGSPARGAGGQGAQIAGGGGTGGMSPDVTWDSGYTEAPDETAHGDYLKLLCSAGLAFDRVHLKYLAEGKLRITRTEREAAGGVQWRVDRARPILPFAEQTPTIPEN
ncbi:MAG TPA: M14 family zinc carboxypeptidase [Bryobacteraceae bacterium]|nr:M14 family zinc carboxypeptidase [Bryobacteraceae bacterium]